MARNETIELPGAPIGRLKARRLRNQILLWTSVALVLLIGFLLTWNEFFAYVPPGYHLVLIHNNGDPLPPGEVLADKRQRGIQKEVKGEGWHFVLPLVYKRQVEKNTIIEPGKVGLVTARGGKPLPAGQVLADPGYQGIQKAVLTPGTYRVNKHGYAVEAVDAVDIPPGFVGVRRRLLGDDGRGRFADKPNEKGILREVLQPGLYYLNPKEYEVKPCEVGIFQTSFRYDRDPKQNTAISFVSKAGFEISMDCTIEWEILPQDMPALLAEYGSRQDIEGKVIDVQAHAIGRDKGIDYGVQDFLEGSKREKFQEDFTNELIRVCRDKNVTVHSAFIRNIVIPENYLKPIRDKQIAAETEITNRAKEATAQSEADVEREQQLISQRVAEVEAETRKLVAGIDREVENTGTRVENEVEKLKAEYEAQIAALDAQRTKAVGEADAEVTRLKETAKSTIYQLKMKVFDGNSDAFLRYTMAQDLNPNMVLRMFHSGPGTFWTNLGKDNVNLLLPTPSPAPSAPAKAATPAGK